MVSSLPCGLECDANILMVQPRGGFIPLKLPFLAAHGLNFANFSMAALTVTNMRFSSANSSLLTKPQLCPPMLPFSLSWWINFHPIPSPLTLCITLCALLAVLSLKFVLATPKRPRQCLYARLVAGGGGRPYVVPAIVCW